jgi:class 3 adenylate cyclase/tetratricopeptide (TPR) repeat protein
VILRTSRPKLDFVPICSKCGHDNPEGFKFCSECGTALALAEAPRVVRKTVTVLFSDVQGSTAMGEQLDPEAMRRALGRYFEATRTVLERHGGTVEKFIGDAVMAIFGIPLLHEDDALRAVRAAAELKEQLVLVNAELERDFGVRIESRTGVNTGEVVAGEGETLATGDAVNVAARLEQAAPVSEVLLGEPTYRLVRDAVEVEPVGSLDLKGKAEPVQAYRLVAVVAGALGHARRLDSPMVGRDRERRRLQDAFEQAVGDRSCQLFTVLGPAGVGKSRLVAEFAGAVEDDATILRGRCLPYGEGITYWPLAEALREAAAIAEDDPPAEARRKLAALVAGEDDGDQIAANVAGLLGLAETAAGGDETFWAVRKLLEALARERALVIVFDDIHWAEPTFLDLIEHIADWSRESPILLLCLARPELVDDRPGWGGGKLNATSVLLEPLSAEQAETLVENLLGQAELAAEVRARIVEAAEGNPLFVEELLAMLIDDGLLERRTGAWTPTADLSTLAIPPTIQVLLAARLDRLDAEERAVVERAAVEGKVFHRGSVAELSSAAARAAVPTRLMTLVRKELIRPDRAAFVGEDAFRFRHLLIRDAAYEALPKEPRAELHERFAVWLEQKAGDRVTEYEEILAYHLEQAFRYRKELGPLDTRSRELATRAVDRLQAVARRAFIHGDMPASTRLLERAAGLLADADARRPEVLIDLGRMLALNGEFERALAAFDRAALEARGLGRREIEVRAEVERASARSQIDASFTGEDLRTLVSSAIGELGGDEDGLAHAWSTLAHAYLIEGQGRLMDEALDEAVAHADRAGNRLLEVDCQTWKARLCWFGPIPTEEGLERCTRLAERGEATLQAVAVQSLGMVFGMRGDFGAARKHLGEAGRAQLELGMVLGRASGVGMMSGVVEALAGDWHTAERHWRAGYEILDQMGEKGYLSTMAGYLAHALCALARYAEAEDMARIADRAGAADDMITQILWRAALAKVVVQSGDFPEAERLARQAVAFAAKTDFLDSHADTLLDLVYVLRTAGRAAETPPLVQEALHLFERKQHLVGIERARTLLAEVAA